MPWMRYCAALVVTLLLKVALPAQWSFEAGPGRLAMPMEIKAGQPAVQLPAQVPIYQRGKLVGRGEIVSWLPKAGMVELRALLPKGRFRVGRPRKRAPAAVPRSRDQNPKAPAVVRAPSLDLDFEWCEGREFPRYRAQGTQPGLEIRADLYRYPGHGLELRMRIFAGRKHDEESRLIVTGQLPASWLEGRELRLTSSTLGGASRLGFSAQWIRDTGITQPVRQTWTLSIPPAYLRPGDGLEILLLALEGRDPEEKAIGHESLRKQLGQGPGKRVLRPAGRLKGRLDRSVILLLADMGNQDPLHRGDQLRRPASKDKPALWSHLEFDLPLGLYLLACERRESRLLTASWQSLAHLMGRDRSRPWRNETLGYRLPVRHGARHGIGRVTLGHVFLESALLVSALRCNRTLFEDAVESLDALSDLVPRSLRESKRLRDSSWPLTNLEMGLRLLDRRPWEKSAESLLGFLDQSFHDGYFDFRENRLPGGGKSFDLWLVAGLLLPALDASKLRGSKKALSLLDRLAKRLPLLPGASSGFSTRYARTANGRWYPSRSTVDPCYQAWLIEGLLGRKGMPASLRSRRRRLLSRLPGEIWDPGTRLAFLLRWPRIRAEVR